MNENNRHDWILSFSAFSTPLLRIWDDGYSGSIPEDDKHMRVRVPDRRLDTRQSQERSLATHADYTNWTHTPYISFTTSKTRIEQLVGMKQDIRGTQFLTVINPNVRIKKLLPIIFMEYKMKNYDVADPYNRDYEYYKNEYLCLWEVTEPDIVGHYNWDILTTNKNWC